MAGWPADLVMIASLAIVGLAAIIIEFFVPAGGLIGLAGAASIIGSIVAAYMKLGAIWGTVTLVVMLITVPLLISFYFKIFPRTPLGKRLILSQVNRDRSGQRYNGLDGEEGIAATNLRPSGKAEIKGEKHSVVSIGEYIKGGERVRVVKVEGSRIVVRRIK